jgi:hypothetical protein
VIARRWTHDRELVERVPAGWQEISVPKSDWPTVRILDARTLAPIRETTLHSPDLDKPAGAYVIRLWEEQSDGSFRSIAVTHDSAVPDSTWWLSAAPDGLIRTIRDLECERCEWAPAPEDPHIYLSTGHTHQAEDRHAIDVNTGKEIAYDFGPADKSLAGFIPDPPKKFRLTHPATGWGDPMGTGHSWEMQHLNARARGAPAGQHPRK